MSAPGQSGGGQAKKKGKKAQAQASPPPPATAAAAAAGRLADIELSPPTRRMSPSPSELTAQEESATDEPSRIPSPSRAGHNDGDRAAAADFASIDVAPSPLPHPSSHVSRHNGGSSSDGSFARRSNLRLQTDSKDEDDVSFSSFAAARAANEFATPLSQSTLASMHPELFERHIEWNPNIAARMPPPGAVPDELRSAFPTNLVVTSRYTAFDFIPRNLFEQFCELSNLWFLFVGLLQAIPAISTTAGIPTHYVPLLFILTVSAMRAAFEDYGRHVLDEIEGAKKYLVYDGTRRAFVTRASADIVVGDIVQMVSGVAPTAEGASVQNSPVWDNGNELHSYPAADDGGGGVSVRTGRDPSVSYSASFPADLLFLSSAHEKGHCFVETASLDGESNLKIKSALIPTHNLLWQGHANDDGNASDDGGAASRSSPSLGRLQGLDVALDIEGPNNKFDSCKGLLTLHPQAPTEVKLALKAENLLLRGTELRNTAFVLGLVVYTGADTKIRRNVASRAANRSKRSSLMQRVNQLLVFMLCFQLLLCLFAAMLCFSFTNGAFDRAWYLALTESPSLAALRSFFTWLIILAQLVPISLLVSNELVKAAQAKFISWDRRCYDPATNQPAVVRNSQLHEDLGQVQYIFSDKTGTLTQNKMEFRVGFIGTRPFGNPDSEIARRVAMRMEQLRRQQLQHSPSPPVAGAGAGAPAPSAASMHREQNLTWTERVAKLSQDASAEQPAFDDGERDRLLTALWGPKRKLTATDSDPPPVPEDPKLASEIRTFLTHMAISNTITPELKARPAAVAPAASSRNALRGWRRGGGGGGGASSSAQAAASSSVVEGSEEYVLNFSSPDELALCKFASACGFQFAARGKDGVQLQVNKRGYGDNQSIVEMYQSLACLDFNSKRKRVTVIYLRDGVVYVMMKGADANVLPLLVAHTAEDAEMRHTLDAQLNDMATKGLRTLVVAGATLPQEWWFGGGSASSSSSGSAAAASGGGMCAIYKALNLPDRGAEKGHHRGECRSECRICAGLLHIERSAQLRLLGASCIEDKLQALVPESIADFLTAGIKVWMLTGDKRETAKNIGLACNLIDPDMESSSDLLGSLDIRDMNRVIEITGDWVSLCASQDRLRAMFDLLDSGGDVVDGVRTGYISRQELQLFLIGMRVPGMDDDRMFDAQWIMANSEGRNNNSSRNVRGDAAPSTPGGSPTAPPEGRIGFQSFCTFIRNLKPSHLKAVQTDIELGLRKARLIAGDGTDEEKRDRLEKCPISLVVEGEAFSVFFPSAPKRNAAVVGGVAGARPSPRRSMWERFTTGSVDAERRAQLAEQDSDDFGSPEVLLLRETFFELASMAKSVICCRLTPSQKGRIVEEFGRKGAVTLAIGDGGNDELMIKRASIGVGITGLEGTAASRASDYAIGQFRFLHTLLFVHGMYNYRRISKLVMFIFYKAGMVAVPMYLFLFASAASGTQFFNDAIYILYNIVFTALPIVFLAIFDTGGVSKESLENNPRAYLSIAHGALFNDSLFFMWMIRAAWNSLWVYGVIYASVGVMDVSGRNGQGHGLWLTSTLVYTAVVLLVTLRILLEAHSINVFIAAVVAISFVLYFPIVFFANTLQRINPNLYGVFGELFGNPNCWLALILCIAGPLLVDVALWSWHRMVSPTYIEVLQERQRLSKSELRRLDHEQAVGAFSSAARVRTRAVPHLTQQQKDDALLAKIRRALTQAQQESARDSAAAGDSSETAQRRAEALVYTMTRLQNLSGSNLDATPQRNILSLYEVAESPSAAQQAALKEKEAALAAEAQKQHQAQQLQAAEAARAAEEARHRQEAERHEQEERRQVKQMRGGKGGGHVRRRSSDKAGASANELVLNLSGDNANEDDEELSDAEPERSIGEFDLAHGRGRVHGAHDQPLANEEEDPESEEQVEIELSVSDNVFERAHGSGDPTEAAGALAGTEGHFVFQDEEERKQK